jgi:hypothetical protein
MKYDVYLLLENATEMNDRDIRSIASKAKNMSLNYVMKADGRCLETRKLLILVHVDSIDPFVLVEELMLSISNHYESRVSLISMQQRGIKVPKDFYDIIVNKIK